MKHPLSLRSVSSSSNGPATVVPSSRQLRHTGRRRCFRRSLYGGAMNELSVARWTDHTPTGPRVKERRALWHVLSCRGRLCPIDRQGDGNNYESDISRLRLGLPRAEARTAE